MVCNLKTLRKSIDKKISFKSKNRTESISGILKEVYGKNLYVNGDWYYFNDLYNIEIYE